MEGGGEASEAAPTHDQEVEVLLLEERKFRYKKKRAPSWPRGATPTLWYQKWVPKSKATFSHTPISTSTSTLYLCAFVRI